VRFQELDRRMRVYETSLDLAVLPTLFMVARVDGRAFTRLTREVHRFKAPYDLRFRDLMTATAVHLMECGFRGILAFTQSDEVSLLLHPDDDTFGRKLRKLGSVLAGEASARFSVELGTPAAFDCRISQLPSLELVLDYFRWRQEDAARNALNGHAYWLLRGEGMSVAEATARLRGMGNSGKHDLLFQAGLNFQHLPPWQKRGSGVYWKAVPVEGENPVTGADAPSSRRRLHVDHDLPLREGLDALVWRLVEEGGAGG